MKTTHGKVRVITENPIDIPDRILQIFVYFLISWLLIPLILLIGRCDNGLFHLLAEPFGKWHGTTADSSSNFSILLARFSSSLTYHSPFKRKTHGHFRGLGCLLIRSSSVPNYPANYPNVLSVASTNASDVKSGFSNYGRWVDVTAPGENILSTYPGNYYAYLSGTSMAAPHVAGVAALLASQGKTNAQIQSIIQTTSDPIPGTGTYWLYGRVNAARAVRS